MKQRRYSQRGDFLDKHADEQKAQKLNYIYTKY